MPKTLEQLTGLRELPDEAVFSEPWEAHAFALALTLAAAGQFRWEEFRLKLIDEVAASDAAVRTGGHGAAYYECWLSALEKLLAARQIAGTDEIDRCAGALAANPPAPTKALTRGPIKIA